jgi:hypothetical protein
MNSEKQRRIEERAYALWEDEGQPHGRHEEHWRCAAREIEAEEIAGDVVPLARTSGRDRATSKSRSRSGRRDSRQRRSTDI